jgi:hypothetical protein
MKRSTFISWFVLITLLAVALAWFWALPPLLTPLFYLHPTDWTDADVVRHIWHFRLLQPEWVSTPPDYMRWSQAETLTRLAVVFLAWLAGTTLLTRRYLSSRKRPSPNHALQPTPGGAGSSAARFTSTGPAWLSLGR